MNEHQEITKASAKLAKTIAKWIGDSNQYFPKIPGLRLSRQTAPTHPTSYTQKPSICLIAQGEKRIILGEEKYRFDASTFLISSVDLPIVANIVKATEEKPYLGIVMELDLQEISQLIIDGELSFQTNKHPQKAIDIESLSLPLINAFQRLLDLLNEKENIKILAPVIKREIFYRLLMTKQGSRLNQIVTLGSHSQQISKAIDWLKTNYTKPLSVGELAEHSGMSKTAFHNHFRSVTSMTPLQFQKRLRLNEARRLMLFENFDALTTTYKVGYESPSQFSREYSRMFGAPPARDIKKLKDFNLA